MEDEPDEYDWVSRTPAGDPLEMPLDVQRQIEREAAKPPCHHGPLARPFVRLLTGFDNMRPISVLIIVVGVVSAIGRQCMSQ